LLIREENLMGSSRRIRPDRLGEKLTEIRKRLGVTTEEIIEKLDCPSVSLSRGTITQYEKGRREPPLLVLLRYARLIGTHADVLIDDELELPRVKRKK
jgi:transcriptional regulator with XRE-family HTH domain